MPTGTESAAYLFKVRSLASQRLRTRGVILAFYRIFGQSFEIETADFWENEKDFGKTTVDSWRLQMAPWRHTNPGGGLVQSSKFEVQRKFRGERGKNSVFTC